MNYLMPLCSFGAGCLTAGVVSLVFGQQQLNQQQAIWHEQLIAEAHAEPGPAPAGLPLPDVPQEGASDAVPAVLPQAIKAADSSSLIRIFRTDRRLNGSLDPVWNVELTVKGQTADRLEAVIGRRNKQLVNRHIPGTEAPLPPGRYRIDRSGIAGPPYNNPELGKGLWVPITPLFATGRSALGFHQDPSWGKSNGESGTSGCIGFQSAAATEQLVKWIKQYNIQTVVVES